MAWSVIPLALCKNGSHNSALCKNCPHNSALCKNGPHNSALCKNCPFESALCKNGSPYYIPKPYVGNMSCGGAAPNDLALCKNGPSQVGSVQKWHSCKNSPHNSAMQKWPVTTRLCAKMALLRRLCAKIAPLITYQNLMLGA